MPREASSEPAVHLTEVVLPGVVEPDGLVVHQRPVPVPGDGQALVEMLATGVSFAEQGMRRNRYPGQPKFPFVLGYDLVGVVDRRRPRRRPRVGRPTRGGGHQDRRLDDARARRRPTISSPLPDGVDPAEAETVVVNGVTAWQMLHRKARVRAGQTILVHGASGGVGQHPGPARPARRHAGHRHRLAAPPRRAARARRRTASTTTTRAWPTASASWRPTASTPSSTTSAARASSAPSACSPPAARWSRYGTAAQRDDTNNIIVTFARPLRPARALEPAAQPPPRAVLQLLGRQARAAGAVPRRLAADLTERALAAGRRFASRRTSPPASRCATPAAAMALAESRTIYGKVVLVP